MFRCRGLVIRCAHTRAVDPQILTLQTRKSRTDRDSKDDGKFLYIFSKEWASEKRRGGPRRIHWGLGAVGMMSIPLATLGLGIWQSMRLRWKLELIEDVRGRLDEKAIDFPVNDLGKLLDMEYKRVRLVGEFLNDREFLIAPRGRFDKGHVAKDHGSLLSENELSSHGGHVITPGWVPACLMDHATRSHTDIRGETAIDAIVRRSEPRPQFMQDNRPEKGIWFYRDHEQMAKHYGTAPIYVEATYEGSMPGGPIGGQTNVRLRNDHFQYLCTWFTLSIITTMMWIAKFYR
ncbi:unnamed protein product, partial [Mesorhabditis spiculigera]